MPSPRFDGARAAFYLIAGVVMLHGVVVLAGLVGCFLYMWPHGAPCDVSGKLGDLLAAALAAALAFGGRRS